MSENSKMALIFAIIKEDPRTATTKSGWKKTQFIFRGLRAYKKMMIHTNLRNTCRLLKE